MPDGEWSVASVSFRPEPNGPDVNGVGPDDRMLALLRIATDVCGLVPTDLHIGQGLMPQGVVPSDPCEGFTADDAAYVERKVDVRPETSRRCFGEDQG